MRGQHDRGTRLDEANHLGEVVHLLALGPLELWQGGRQYPLGSLKERRVLAVLLYAQGDPVAVDTLVERVWDDEVPVTAVETLHSYLSRLRTRLRRAVGDLAVLERPSPRRYRLRVRHADDVDFVRLQRLRDEARAAAGRGDREYAVGLLHTAASLWRGEPFAEFTGDWAASARARLTEDHRRVREERIRLELELGRHADLLGELHELVSLNPLAQQAVTALMLALYRSGRDGEALALYRTTRRRLNEELGIDPGTELQELQRRILGQDPALREHHAAVAEPGTGRGRGASQAADRAAGHPGSSLPRDTRDFTGRASELGFLLAAHGPDGNGTALPVTVVHGMPGVGKSALIVHAAHRMRERYPDGQFYVDLRAYSDQPPQDPADALAFLLHTVGVPDPLPVTLDERAARWREWTARHRVLVVLDNARDAEQIRPLLPGSPDCRAIVASRNRLTELDGATPLLLDVLSVTEAGALFARIAGAARVSDTVALRRVVELCGRHPLTLQLHASRFRHRDTWDLEYVADRLDGAGDRLEEFDERVAAALEMSCADLDASARSLFRRLALHPGPDITLEAAMALSGDVDPGAVRRAAETLLDRHLLDEPVRDRYQLHDLARAFAGRLGRREDPPTERRGALRRLLSYYLTAADRADRLAHPRRRRRRVPRELIAPVTPGFAAEPPTGSAAEEASVWLTVERGNLLAVARTAAAEFPEYAALFPHVLAHSLQRWGTHDITAELQAAALIALRSGEDRPALARTLVERASVLARENHNAALEHATEALTLFEELGDPRGRADALLEIGRAHLGAGRGEACLRELDRCLVLYRAVDDPHGIAATLNVQGTARVHRAEYTEATHCFRTMLGINRELRDRHGEAVAWNNLGDIRLALGLPEEAGYHYEHALVLMRDIGGKKDLAILDTNLGAVYSATGQPGRALACFRRALASHRAGGDAIGEVNTLISLGETCAGSGRTKDALDHFGAAEKVARRIDNSYERQRALLGIADTHYRERRWGISLETYRKALSIAHEHSYSLCSARALAGISRVSLRMNDVPSARAHAERALAMYRRLGADGEAAELGRVFDDWGATGS